MNQRYYVLKIKLQGVEPEIWRRFVVPGDITLDRLHDVIQIVMGWEDKHLYEFAIGKKRYSEDIEFEDEGLMAEQFRLIDLIKQKGRTFDYIYDLGDDWVHEVTIENSRYESDALPMPIFCLEGERSCPPEDVGGVEGYFEICAAIKDPEYPDRENLLGWVDPAFDGEAFDIDEVNQVLAQYLRWSRNRALKFL